MKIWLINNTKFGYKNNSKEWSKNMFDYFNNIFIPFIEKNHKSGDILVHLGNLFYSTENVNISILLQVNELLNKLNKILPVYILPGYNESSNITNILNIQTITKQIDNVSFVPQTKNILQNINNDIIITNSKIDISILEKYSDKLFFIGNHDNKEEINNIIKIGALYQFEDTDNDKGFYILDTVSKKYKFIKNNYSPQYSKIIITDISQIDNIDIDYVNKNNVDLIIDKSMISDKNIKLDVLLSKFNFKSITYTNDIQKEQMDDISFNMEDIIRERIEKTNNADLIKEFENIITIYKEKY
ncbi:hypothetical protein M0Q97_07135 [Candidatus Dojkabacteria bacterium]|jgi:hypothetical protein|nr:hypothetical protein [Candidatus Dojkabacteria bacterium]